MVRKFQKYYKVAGIIVACLTFIGALGACVVKVSKYITIIDRVDDIEKKMARFDRYVTQLKTLRILKDGGFR